jgi:hypothetical protein
MVPEDSSPIITACIFNLYDCQIWYIPVCNSRIPFAVTQHILPYDSPQYGETHADKR